jgi:GNAT superfamily N-acetyltransferase
VGQHIQRADDGDVETLTALINRAYEPAESILYDGARVTAGEIRQKLHRGAFLMAIGGESEAIGAVYVECRGETGYFGLLAVAPEHQGKGIGQSLVGAAEQFCRNAGCDALEIEVVNHRRSLLSYYAKRGYAVTGERPFNFDKLRVPSHFLILEKSLCHAR